MIVGKTIHGEAKKQDCRLGLIVMQYYFYYLKYTFLYNFVIYIYRIFILT